MSEGLPQVQMESLGTQDVRRTSSTGGDKVIDWITLDLKQGRLYVYDENHIIIPLRPELQGSDRLWAPIPENDVDFLRSRVDELIDRLKGQTP
jgi:hypothetical protein